MDEESSILVNCWQFRLLRIHWFYNFITILGTGFRPPSLEAMDEAQQKEFVANNMDSDLQFILSDSGVSLEGQVSIARRYGSMRKFRAVGDTRADVRRSCLQDFAIVQDTPDGRAETAAVVSAWEVAQEYISKEVEIRAEAKVLGQPRA